MSSQTVSLLPPSSTVLLTGGATGIGLGLAKVLVSKGHKVIISGRRQNKLDEAKAQVPSLITIRGDVENDDDRFKLFEQVTRDHPQVNVLINNAGVYSYYDPDKLSEKSEWEQFKQVGRINTEGTIHLSYLFANYFKSKPKALIVNVTSGVAWVPLVKNIAYSMSKAALHHFSIGLRIHLKDTSISVVEAYPGPVDTDMLPEKYKSMAATVDAYTSDVISQIEQGHVEFGMTGTPFEGLSTASADTIQGLIAGFNQ